MTQEKTDPVSIKFAHTASAEDIIVVLNAMAMVTDDAGLINKLKKNDNIKLEKIPNDSKK
jgi:hypothetical protein